MDYNVSSKVEQRGVLAGMLLGVGRKEGYNFFIQHSQTQLDYLLFKKHLLEEITRKPISLQHRETRQGKQLFRIEPKRIPLIRILVQKIYRDCQKSVTRKFLNFLTPQGIGIWFMDKGSKSFKRKGGKIRAIEVFLNTHFSKEENEIIITYFWERWGFRWGLSKTRKGYRLRMGTKAGKDFFTFLRPYVRPSMLHIIQTSYNTTAAT
ncbi:DNA endonuclease [Lusitaniella coriacea LEGE 07157]|uniref:DNA endonuclease n=1 Tax=Lusitaniella coriacea LEGE 07157 TaxID=945747 RepID=A0A8J7DZS3_9CYAN|nr:DNA endonuclease [Lusitaniella coriacea]MBE9118674.1 DNA endonuclease [Lusitaniella coriacea LEGE 07157]